MPGENEKVAELEGQVTDLEKRIQDLTESGENADLAKALADQKELLEKMDQLSDALETSLVERESLQTELKIAKEMSDDEKEYCKDMEFGEKMSFMSKSPEERKAAMAKRDENDESVTISGRTIRKSVVGEDAFVIMKAQADEIAANKKQLTDEIAKREMAELLKRADEEFSHVPGTPEERAKLLHVIAKMDEPLRTSFETVLTQAEKLSKAGFATLGGGDGGRGPDTRNVAKAVQDFETKIAEIKKRDSCSNAEALTKARKAHPDLFKVYQEVENSAS